MAADHKGDALHDVFMAFCKFGDKDNKGDMNTKSWSKFYKDTNLIDKTWTSADGDILFSKHKPKGGQKIQYAEFVKALHDIATKKKITYEALVQHVLANGPKSSGTHADEVRFHDDKSSYTGVYAQGGPKTVGDGGVTLDGLLDRSPADVRGRKT